MQDPSISMPVPLHLVLKSLAFRLPMTNLEMEIIAGVAFKKLTILHSAHHFKDTFI